MVEVVVEDGKEVSNGLSSLLVDNAGAMLLNPPGLIVYSDTVA